METKENQIPDRLSILLPIFLFCIISVVQAQPYRDLKPFIILGKIAGMDSGTIAISYPQKGDDLMKSFKNGTYCCDAVQIKNGEFYFEGSILQPTVAVINCESFRYVTGLYIEPGIMKLALAKDNFSEFKITGSKTQDESNELKFILKPLKDRTDYLRRELMHLDSLYRKTRDEKIVNQLNYIAGIMDSIDLKNMALRINFVRSHPKSYISRNILDDASITDILPLDSLITLYKGFSKFIRTSGNGQRIKKEIAQRKKSVVGVKAPEFKTIDINDRPLYLSDFKRKNDVLLVFWSSWNFYSRKALPRLNEIYKKYRSKGIVLIGAVSVIGKDQWKNTIDRDSLSSWQHVLATGKYIRDPKIVDDLRSLYSVDGDSYYDILPVEILINKRGKIIGRWQGELESLEKKLKEFYRVK